jgi:hypothetical protein
MEATSFFSRHLVFAAILVSALWFYSGHQFVAKGRKGVALAWEVIAVLVLLAYCVNAIITRDWLSLVVAFCFVALEVWLMMKYARRVVSSDTSCPK